MLLRKVLVELAKIKGYESLIKMLPYKDYCMIIKFTRKKDYEALKIIIRQIKVLQRIANLFDVTPSFLLRICELERIDDERIGERNS